MACHRIPYRSPMVASAIRVMISTSDFRCSLAGSSGPREEWTTQVESSTEIHCGPDAWTSFSVRPLVGRISAVVPQHRCERLILVEMWTVIRARRIASTTTSVSGTACTKLPPRPRKKWALPSRSARIESTVSWPCSRGGSKPNSFWSASRKLSGVRSQIPIVRSPWTLEWPRTGSTPAPGLPMSPRTSARLTISLIVATALWCWVMPHRPAPDGGVGVADHRARPR